MEFNVLDIVQHVLNIVVLYIILRAVLYNPVRKFMLQREAAEHQKREQITSALAEAEALRLENERQLADAQSRTKQLVDAKMAYADEVAGQTIENAKKEASNLLMEGRAQLNAEREEAQAELTDQTSALAIDIATRILRRELTLEDNQRIIDDYFQRVG